MPDHIVHSHITCTETCGPGLWSFPGTRLRRIARKLRRKNLPHVTTTNGIHLFFRITTETDPTPHFNAVHAELQRAVVDAAVDCRCLSHMAPVPSPLPFVP